MSLIKSIQITMAIIDVLNTQVAPVTDIARNITVNPSYVNEKVVDYCTPTLEDVVDTEENDKEKSEEENCEVLDSKTSQGGNGEEDEEISASEAGERWSSVDSSEEYNENYHSELTPENNEYAQENFGSEDNDYSISNASEEEEEGIDY